MVLLSGQVLRLHLAVSHLKHEPRSELIWKGPTQTKLNRNLMEDYIIIIPS